MISVFRESGFPVEVHASPEGIELEFPTELGAEARRKFEDRDRVAAVAAVERVLRPRSVAVIGASRRPDSFGGLAFGHALANGFRGELYPVNPNADFVGSRRALAIDAGGGPGDRGRARGDRARRRARVRRGRRRGAGRDQRGVRRGRARRRGAARGAARGVPLERDAARRSELHGGRQHAPRRVPDRDVRARRCPRRDDRLRVPERRVRRGGDRRRLAPRDRAVGVRLARRQGRPVEQRPAAVLGAGPGHPGRGAVPGVVRQPAQVRPRGAARRARQAGAGGQGRADVGRRSGGVLPHRRADRRLRQHRRRAVRERGRDPLRRARRPARRRRRARGAGRAGRQPRGDRGQRARPARRVRRRVRRRRARRSSATSCRPVSARTSSPRPSKA